MNQNSGLPETQLNRKTKLIATVSGILLAFAGFEHGLFEALQGSRRTGGIGIHAISESMKWWEHGTEDALTLIPNFLATGILAMLVSLAIMAWSLFCLDRKRGPTVFLALFWVLVAVGGGIGFIPFFLIAWAYATRIDKPLVWWRKRFGEGAARRWAGIWPFSLAGTAFCWLAAIEIAVFGYFPGQTDPDKLFNICWSFLFLALVLLNLSFISGFAADITKPASKAQPPTRT